MSLPNILTLSRIPFLFLIAALLVFPWPGAHTLAFVLFIVAGVTDWIDGHYARRYGLVSTFGKLMDALTDKILMVGLFVTLVMMNALPFQKLSLLLVLVILSREFFITGLRLVAAANGVVLAAEKAGKQKTVSQILSMSFLLASLAVRNDFAALLGVDLVWLADWFLWIGWGLFLFAALLTVVSGMVYTLKYSGRLLAPTDGKRTDAT